MPSAICENCGFENKAFFFYEGDHILENTLTACHNCEVVAVVWKKAEAKTNK